VLVHRRGRRGVATFVALVLGAVVLAACGGGGGGGGKVAVALTDYDVLVQPSSVASGKVELSITNRGAFVHEIIVVRSDLSVPQLPKTADGRFDEQGAGVQVMAEARDVAAGASASLAVKLDAGRYYLICNRPAEAGDTLSHFAHAMLSPLTVTS
jgi:hypothetical protein